MRNVLDSYRTNKSHLVLRICWKFTQVQMSLRLRDGEFVAISKSTEAVCQKKKNLKKKWKIRILFLSEYVTFFTIRFFQARSRSVWRVFSATKSITAGAIKVGAVEKVLRCHRGPGVVESAVFTGRGLGDNILPYDPQTTDTVQFEA